MAFYHKDKIDPTYIFQYLSNKNITVEPIFKVDPDEIKFAETLNQYMEIFGNIDCRRRRKIRCLSYKNRIPFNDEFILEHTLFINVSISR